MKLTEKDNLILDYLNEQKKWLSMIEIKDALSPGKTDRTWAAHSLRKLYKEGLAEKDGTYFRNATTVPAASGLTTSQTRTYGEVA